MAGLSKAFSGLPKQGEPDVREDVRAAGKDHRGAEGLDLPDQLRDAGAADALIVVGYLLFQAAPVSRALSIGWALAALVYLPIMLWVQVMIIQPRTTEITGR